ncbi:hydroxymethylglutaryl-CoA reductase, degradative [Candidatus Micrarchaeota archaeon]|nr:hydroxymethylglutaryl-CoA reductase, degradative [Candidatus Micrarchaeota archaeon]
MVDFSGFYKLSVKERLERVRLFANLTPEDLSLLQDSGALDLSVADKLVENVIGAVHLPLGLATNFLINNKQYVVPMAIEEPSVIAAASKAAKLSLPSGFTASSDDPVMIGQIQLVNLPDPSGAVSLFESHQNEILAVASDFLKPKEKYGCKVLGVSGQLIDTIRGKMFILFFQINVGDAQGANMINGTLEAVSSKIREIFGGQIRLRILSNLAIYRKSRASAIWKRSIVGEDVIEGVMDAYAFAEADPYRCATHNKGIMNGVSSVVVATGNDWRSIEAGAHSYAAFLSTYRSLTKYWIDKNGDLVGFIELPTAVATVGPAINSSPTAKTVLKILGVKSSSELGMVLAAVGLANNFAALSALSTEGIQKGHMKLHARAVALNAGAKADEADLVAAILSKENDFSTANVHKILSRIRPQK